MSTGIGCSYFSVHAISLVRMIYVYTYSGLMMHN